MQALVVLHILQEETPIWTANVTERTNESHFAEKKESKTIPPTTLENT